MVRDHLAAMGFASHLLDDAAAEASWRSLSDKFFATALRMGSVAPLQIQRGVRGGARQLSASPSWGPAHHAREQNGGAVCNACCQMCLDP